MKKLFEKLKNIKNFRKKNPIPDEFAPTEETLLENFEEESEEFEESSEESEDLRADDLSEGPIEEDGTQFIQISRSNQFKDRLQLVWRKIHDKFLALKNNPKALNLLPQKKGGGFNLNINTSNIAESLKNISAPPQRELIHRCFNWSLLIILPYLTGKILAVILAPPVEISEKKARAAQAHPSLDFANYAVIQTADLFQAKKEKREEDAKKKPKEDEVKICLEAKNASSLPIKLINSIVIQDSIKSIASVESRSSGLERVREGDIISGLAQVGRILPYELVVKNLQSGKCELIKSSDPMERSKSPINVLSSTEGRQALNAQNNKKQILSDGNKFNIKKQFLNDQLKDIGSILTQARAIQITNPDGSLSFNIQEVEPGSIYSTLDIQNNDTITQINGKKIQSINQVMELFGRVRQLDKLELSVSRGGIETTRSYNFEN